MLSFIVHLTLIVRDWMKNREQEVALSHQKEEMGQGEVIPQGTWEPEGKCISFLPTSQSHWVWLVC